MQNKKYLLIVLFMLLFIPIKSEPIWQLMRYDNQNEAFLEIDCPDSCDCIALISHKSYCRLIRSTDGGFSWDIIYDETREQGSSTPIPQPLHVFDMAYVDSNHLYIAYEHAKIKQSHDRGKSWDTIQIDFKYSNIRNIEMCDSITGIATTNTPEFAITNSGWDKSEIMQVPGLNGIYDVYMHSYDEFLIASGYGKMQKTIDRGNTWHLFQVDSTFPTKDFFFLNDSLGWAIGGIRNYYGAQSSDVIYKTTDRGFTWEKIYDKELEPIFGLQDIEFFDEMNGVAVGQFQKILRTTDGGVTWKQEWLHEHEERSPPTMRIGYAGSRPIAATYGEGVFVRVDTTIFSATRPELLIPANNTKNLENSVSFSWSEAKEADAYKIKISDDPDFNNIIADNIINDTTLTISIFDNYIKYYWKVANLVNEDYLWSEEIFSFQTKMGVPVNQFPECSSVEVSPNPLLKWTEIKGAKYYELAINDSTLNQENISKNEYQLNNLDSGQTYSWKVRALTHHTTFGGEKSEWSEECGFIVIKPYVSVFEGGTYNTLITSKYLIVKFNSAFLTNIKISIVDINGNIIKTKTDTINAGESNIEIPVDELVSGTYIYTIEIDGMLLETNKFVVVK